MLILLFQNNIPVAIYIVPVTFITLVPGENHRHVRVAYKNNL